MAQRGKKYLEAAKLVDRERPLPSPLRRPRLVKETTTVSFDATIEAHLRLGVDPRHADQMVRGTVVLPHGTGRVGPGRGLRPGREGPRGASRRRRRGRRRGPREEGRGRLAGVRCRPGDARFHGHRRPARQDPRSSRPDAEPEGRDDHLRSRAGDPGDQGRSGRVPGRQGGDHPRPGGQEQLRAAMRSSTTSRPSSTRSTAPSRRVRRASTCAR